MDATNVTGNWSSHDPASPEWSTCLAKNPPSLEIILPLQMCPVNDPMDWSSPYAAQATWSFYHATTWHHTVADSRIILHPSYLISLYDSKYTSLTEDNKLPVRKHRLTALSSEDSVTFNAEVSQALTAWRDDNYGTHSGGIDWSAISHAVLDRNEGRLAELREFFRNLSPSSNITEAIGRVRLLTFALLMPYVDFASALSFDVTKDSRASSLSNAARRCSLAFTGHFDILHLELNAQEHRLKGAIEGVLKRICAFATDILEQSLTLLETIETSRSLDETKHRKKIETWANDLDALMHWLGWAIWHRCPQLCDFGVSTVMINYSRG